MSKNVEFNMDANSFNKKYRKLIKAMPKLFKRAREKADIQMITWMNEGSMKEPGKPPILTGALRGSATAFTGSDRVKSFGGKYSPIMTEVLDKTTSAFVYNTPYATKMHETWEPPGGPFSQQDQNVTAQWMTKHLKKDKQIYIKIIAAYLEKKSDRGQL